MRHKAVAAAGVCGDRSDAGERDAFQELIFPIEQFHEIVHGRRACESDDIDFMMCQKREQLILVLQIRRGHVCFSDNAMRAHRFDAFRENISRFLRTREEYALALLHLLFHLCQEIFRLVFFRHAVTGKTVFSKLFRRDRSDGCDLYMSQRTDVFALLEETVEEAVYPILTGENDPLEGGDLCNAFVKTCIVI